MEILFIASCLQIVAQRRLAINFLEHNQHWEEIDENLYELHPINSPIKTPRI